METRCSHKKLKFQRYPPKDLCTARYEHKSSKKKFQTFQKPRKLIPGPILGQDRPEKTQAKSFVRSGEIPSPGQKSIDKTNDCAMKSERGALLRGSDPPSGHSVHKMAADTWRAPARRLIQTLLCRKHATKHLDPSPMAKNTHFFQVWEKSVGRRGKLLAP